ncbi:MAG TPA: molybdopterin-dependent oxidoreductase [Candidatus Eisenbacteria bacterium]|nr:molybdopterin-dependent oxidoreductase [Candidatus Eisenbacteria bacterium]
MPTIASSCAYCGCGCRLLFEVEGNKILKMLPDKADNPSEGIACVKGLTIHDAVRNNAGRILKPMLRKDKSKPLKETSWEEAYRFIREQTKDLAPSEVFFNASGKVTNEDCYVTQKFARIAYKTSNVDACCARLCHVTTVQGLEDCFGSRAAFSKMDDVYGLDTLFIIGSNPISNYPVLYNRILKAKRKGLKILSSQAVYSLTAKFSDVSLIIYPGTELVLLNGIINALIHNKAYDKSAESVEGFRRLAQVAELYNIDFVRQVCKVELDSLERLIDQISQAKALGIIHGMGLTQHGTGSANVHALLNLMILKNAQLLSLRGEINVQGAGDMGCLPDRLPSGPTATALELEEKWHTNVPMGKGKTIIETFLISPPKAAFVSGMNVAQSLPNLNVAHKNLGNMFLVVLDNYHNLTTKFADVVLPTPLLFEREGTITTGERRVRFVRKVVEPCGECKPEWQIFKELSGLFGVSDHFAYEKSIDITREIVDIVPAYRQIAVDNVYVGEDAWPEKRMLFKRFVPEHFEGVEDIRSDKYPLILTSFRSMHHFLTGEITNKSRILSSFGEGPFCYISPKDADEMTITNGELVEVSSNAGSLTCPVRIDINIPKGIVGMHFHFEELLVNKLFPTQFDEKTFTPNYKMVAVGIRKA